MEAIAAAVITAFASVICQAIISARASSVIKYRIDKLEDEVAKHNQLVERLCAVEHSVKYNARRIDSIGSARLS